MPGSQFWQEAAPLSEALAHFPGVQNWHVALLLAPVEAEEVPGPHGVHEVWPPKGV